MLDYTEQKELREWGAVYKDIIEVQQPNLIRCFDAAKSSHDAAKSPHDFLPQKSDLP